MSRRGGSISNFVWDPYSVRTPYVKSTMGSFLKIHNNNVVVILFIVIGMLGLFCILLMMTSSGWASIDFQRHSAYEERILKMENLRLSLEASERKLTKTEDDKKNLLTKLELVSKKFLDMRVEFDKANRNSKRVKTEMDDRLNHALTEGSKALANYHNVKARADELDETLREVRAERRQVQIENEALAVKLGRAIQKGEAAEDEINKLKEYYRIRSDIPKAAIMVPRTDPAQKLGVSKTGTGPIQIIREADLRTIQEEVQKENVHHKPTRGVISKANDLETVLVSPPTEKERNVQATNRDEV